MAKLYQQGFSLVELSIVLIVIGTLASSAVVPLASSMKHAHVKRTAAQLVSIREAMHGYLASTGRLPCPVRLGVIASDTVSAAKPCAVEHGGVPAALLGVMGEQSADGALLDAWGRAYLYSVSFSDSQEHGQLGAPDWLTVGEPASVGTANITATLELCRTNATKSCAKKDLIANQIVWVILSTGELSTDTKLQSENIDHDHVFVHSAYSSNKDQPFNDQIIWASRSELVYWLLKANWLP